MDGWLKAALDYLPQWLDYQMRLSEQPGCAIAVAHRGRLVLERAFGHADAAAGQGLTPRHRFRVASHSKTFTAAGIMKLREQSRLRLDDPVGRWVDGLHPAVAEATPAQLLSHGAGLVRDGADAGQWQDRRPFADVRALRAALAEPPVLPSNSRFKYSNHGYGLLGLLIEAVVGEPYRDWIRREVVAAAGLVETEPDVPPPRGARLARGHTGRLPLGRRLVVPGDNPTNALAPATGFVATAGDLARFFAQLDPAASGSILAPASRREMVRRLWRNPHTTPAQHYGLGVAWGRVGDWDWFGHGGGFQSCLSRTSVLPSRGLAVSVLTNALDGMAHQWSDGVIRILRRFAQAGPPSPKVRGWTGRWWGLWGTVDLVPMGDAVLAAAPGLLDPFADAAEIAVDGRDRGTIREAGGYASHGEPVRRLRDRQGRVREVWLAGTRLLPEARLKAEMRRRYDEGKRHEGR